MTLQAIIAAHEKVLSRPQAGLAGIPFPRFEVWPGRDEGWVVIDHLDGSEAYWDMGETEARAEAVKLNARAWAERRAEIEGAAERQGEPFGCETDR